MNRQFRNRSRELNAHAAMRGETDDLAVCQLDVSTVEYNLIKKRCDRYDEEKVRQHKQKARAYGNVPSWGPSPTYHAAVGSLPRE